MTGQEKPVYHNPKKWVMTNCHVRSYHTEDSLSGTRLPFSVRSALTSYVRPGGSGKTNSCLSHNFVLKAPNTITLLNQFLLDSGTFGLSVWSTSYYHSTVTVFCFTKIRNFSYSVKKTLIFFLFYHCWNIIVFLVNGTGTQCFCSCVSEQCVWGPEFLTIFVLIRVDGLYVFVSIFLNHSTNILLLFLSVK